MPGWIGPAELIPSILVVLPIFGPKRLPEMGRSLGRGMREFKDGILSKETSPEGQELSERAPRRST